MKIVAFNGSPRKGGNTQLLLQEAVRGAKEQGAEATVFDLNWMNIKPCQNCGGCAETGKCIIPDNMQRVHEEIRAADRIIVASPIFFFGLTGQMKIMIDRCQPFWYEKYIHQKPVPLGPLGRKGLVLLIGGMKRSPRNKGFECSEIMARVFLRTVNVPEHAVLEFDGVDHLGAIKEHPTALKEGYEAGRTLAG